MQEDHGVFLYSLIYNGGGVIQHSSGVLLLVVDELRTLLRSWPSWCMWESGAVASVKVLLEVLIVVVSLHGLTSFHVECMCSTSLIEEEERSGAFFVLIF